MKVHCLCKTCRFEFNFELIPKKVGGLHLSGLTCPNCKLDLDFDIEGV